MVVHVCNFNAGEVEAKDSMKFTYQLYYLIYEAQVTGTDHLLCMIGALYTYMIFLNEYTFFKRMTAPEEQCLRLICGFYTNTYPCTCTSTHIYIYPHTSSIQLPHPNTQKLCASGESEPLFSKWMGGKRKWKKI